MLNSMSIDKPRILSDVLIEEVSQCWCRESGIMTSCNEDLPIGTVLAQKADGSYVPFLLSAEDTDAVAILITTVLASEEPSSCVVIRRGCVVAADNLFFLDSTTDENKKTALGQLYALSIIPQE